MKNTDVGRIFFIAFISALWLAFLLAELDLFKAWICLAVAAFVFVLIFFLQIPSPIDKSTYFAIATAFGTLFLTLPPSEMISGGWDPGVYLHAGAAVAKGGSLRIEDPDLAHFSDDEKRVVARDLHGIVEPFGGMRVLPDGRISPAFHHLYPSLLAIAASIGGIWAELLVNPLLNIASLLAFYALALRIVKPRYALMAMWLLALNPAQIWQAQFSTAEMLTQFLLLGGMTFLIDALERESKKTFSAIIGGAAIGMALLARYDTILFIVPCFIFLSFSWHTYGNRRNLLVVMITIALFVVHYLLHHHFIAPYYEPVGHLVTQGLILALLTALVGLGLLYAPFIRGHVHVDRWKKSLRFVLIAGFVAWIVFAWLIRPQLVEPGLITRGMDKILPDSVMGLLVTHDAQNMLYLSSLWGTAGLLLALAGIVLLIIYCESFVVRAWLYASIGVMMLLVTNVFNDHFLMWVSRRFIPVVMPLLAVGAAFALSRVPSKLSWAILALVIGLNVPGIKTVAQTRDWPGLVAWYESFENTIPDQTLLYCDQPGFAAPLRYLYDKRAFELHLRTDDRRAQLANLIKQKLQSGEDVIFLTMSGPIPDPNLSFELLSAMPLETHILNSARVGMPRGTKSRGGNFELYRVRLK